MNGVGAKAVNALSSHFIARSVRDGQMREAVFAKGELISDTTQSTEEEMVLIFSLSPITPCF